MAESADRQLLLAVMAVQLGFTDAATVIAAGAEWAANRDARLSLPDILVRRKKLTDAQVKLLLEVVEKTTALHGGLDATLQSLPPVVVKSLSDTLGGGFANTLNSGEHEGPADSFENLENVVAESPGRYEPLRREDGGEVELGRGGIGRVVLEEDRFVGREVAMKQLLKEHTSNPHLDTAASVGLEARFLREARVTAQLEHPAIVPVHEIGRRKDGSLYYTMRRIQGQTLHAAILNSHSLEERLKLMPAFLATCQAVAYSHSRGVIHRDLKPQNVMMGPFGETYLLDWGLARVLGKSDPRAQQLRMAPDITAGTNPGAVGTPSYMAPEQAMGKVDQVDARSDVWGLGAILFQILTGRPPFEGRHAMEVIARIAHEDPPAARSLVPEVPVDLLAVCDKALTREKDGRYPSARELMLDVDAWLQGRRVSAYLYRAPDKVRRFVRKYRLALIVASGALVALLSLGVASYQRIRAERNQTRQFAQLMLGEVLDKLSPMAGNQDLIDRLTRSTTEFYEHKLKEKLSPEEQEMLTLAWVRLGRLNADLGRADEASRCLNRCLEEAKEPLPNTAEAQVLTAECLLALGDLSQNTGHYPEALGHYNAAVKELDALAPRFGNEIKWLKTFSISQNRKGRAALAEGDGKRALEAFQRSLDAYTRIEQLAPNDDDARIGHAAALRDMALSFHDDTPPERALEMGEQAIAVARSGQRTGDVKGMMMLGSTLRQQGMFLMWTDQPRGASYLEEAVAVLKAAHSREPGHVGLVGELTDTLLEVGRVDEAYGYALLADSMGARGEFESAYLLAALVSNHELEVLRRKASALKNDDAQSRLVLGLALAATGDAAEGGAVLEANADEIATKPLQWPRGVVKRWAERQGSDVRQPLVTFTEEFEKAFMGEDKEKRDAIEKLAHALKSIPRVEHPR